MATKTQRELLRQGLSVLTGGDSPLLVDTVYSSGNSVIVVLPDGDEVTFKATKLNVAQNSGRIVFTSNRVLHHVRELRETDGQWVSQYQTDLPLEALESLPYERGTMDPDSMVAYASEDSPYILGVVYSTGEESWVRTDGGWLLIAEDDTTYNGMESIAIDPARSNEFLDLYDHNYVSVSDAQEYESAESSRPSGADDDDSDE